MDVKKYDAYTVADFLEHSEFIEYIKYDRHAADWQSWLDSNPPNREAYEEASTYLKMILTAERIRPAAYAVDEVFDRIRSGIERQEKEKHKIVYLRRYAVAAAAILLVFAAGWYYYTGKITIATGYAQQQVVVLPDHSTITLNANSSITWYRSWKWRQQREIWLKGEALFKVHHTPGDTTTSMPPARQFTAHAGGLSVEVLGTVFNIRQRRNVISIALLEGKISVTSGQQITNRPETAPLILHPGESVEYNDTVARLSRIVKLPNQPQAWLDHKIQANGMTVQDIIDNYEDTYGHRIILINPAQANKRIDGTISLTTEEGVLYTLANILNANIERQGNLIYLRPK